MANPQVVVDFIANTSKLTAGFSQAGSGATGFGSKIKGMARAGVAAAGAAGLAALAATVKIGADEMSQAAKVSAQTAAVLKSTGGAAGVSAKQVSALAGALMRKSGIDDEAIQSGENLLLTFTKVQNKAGKGNDIFNRATKTMVDMSVALGQDMGTSAVQLGKALNDPIKGVSALQRVGVSFTAGQKAQIKALVDSGQTMKAQKIILKELNTEFGGSAAAAGKTLPGQLNILKQSFSNLAGEMMSKLVPALTAVTKFFIEHPKLAKALVVGVLAVAAAMVVLNAALAVSAALSAPYIGLILGIGAAVAALIIVAVLLAKNWDKVTAVLKAGFDIIKRAAASVFAWIKANWPLLLGILTGPVGLAVAMIIRNWNTIRAVTTGAWNAIRAVTSAVWNAVRAVVSAAVNATTGAVRSAWNTIQSFTSRAWGAVRSSVSSVVSAVKSTLSGLASWISGLVSGALGTALNRARAIFSRISDGARDAVAAVRTAMNGVVNAIENIVGRVSRAASSVSNAIKGPINAVLRAWNSITLTIPRVTIPSFKIGPKKFGGGSFGGGSIGFPDVPLLAKGGVVTSPTLAMVGEQGTEIVAPEKMLRDIVGDRNVQVRVFIGDQELRGLVRTEIVDANTGIARTVLAGAGR